MRFGRLKEDRYLLVLLAFAAIFIIYWSAFSHYRYATFSSSYYDIGVELYSMYWHVHGLAYYSNPIDYLVFTNHISIFSLLLVPVFALYEKPMTLFLVQDVFLAMTAILVYFTASELVNSRKIGFAMSAAFLINPATNGLVLFDFHLEAIVVFFYVLSFYFYMKRRNVYFIISYVLLLSLYDVEPVVGASLLIGLLIYEILYNRIAKNSGKEFTRKITMLLVGLAITAAFFVFYLKAAAYISSTYSAIPNSAIVPIQRLKNYVSEQLSVVFGSGSFSYNTPLLEGGAAVGLSVAFFGFGISSFMNPVISIVLYLPWLVEILIVHNSAFAYPYSQDYSFFLGGSIVSAILGFIIMSKGKLSFIRLDKSGIGKLENRLAAIIIVAAVILAILDLFPVRGTLLLNYAPRIDYGKISAAIAMIPKNATVMAQAGIAPHMYETHSLELPPVDEPAWFKPVGVKVYWEKPEYIITDSNVQGYSELRSKSFDIRNFTMYNYTVYYNNSGIMIYKMKGQ